MLNQKYKNIKLHSNGMILRVKEIIALDKVSSGNASYASKKSLKRYWKNQEKLHKNSLILKGVNMENVTQSNSRLKTIAHIPRRNKYGGILSKQRFIVHFK